MMPMRPLLFACLLSTGTTLCFAGSPPAPPAWASAAGFSPVDADAVESAAYYSAERFPGQGASAFNPDADLAPPVRALLLVEHREGLLPHARYRVSWHVAADAQAPDRNLDYVEVQRFNLGPARHEDLRGSVPDEHLADVSEFGVGPDVAWRFVMAQRQGMRAGVEEAARRELSAGESTAMDCLGSPCAALAGPAGPEGEWFGRDVSAPPDRYAAVAGDGSPHPARVAGDLVLAMGEEADRPAPFNPAAPRFMFVISANVDGQDLATTALARDTLVFDDDIGTIWARWHQVSGATPESALLYQSRTR
ncbi:hypothetical protein WCE37_13335 [Luteimonas sp. MJ250]|uniref:hypothetical protein n=1 Tax=Luteimonas sp. MJ250 TaxID=3129236 RepID=UPI0031BA64B5